MSVVHPIDSGNDAVNTAQDWQIKELIGASLYGACTCCAHVAFPIFRDCAWTWSQGELSTLALLSETHRMGDTAVRLHARSLTNNSGKASDPAGRVSGATASNLMYHTYNNSGGVLFGIVTLDAKLCLLSRPAHHPPSWAAAKEV